MVFLVLLVCVFHLTIQLPNKYALYKVYENPVIDCPLDDGVYPPGTWQECTSEYLSLLPYKFGECLPVLNYDPFHSRHYALTENSVRVEIYNESGCAASSYWKDEIYTKDISCVDPIPFPPYGGRYKLQFSGFSPSLMIESDPIHHYYYAFAYLHNISDTFCESRPVYNSFQVMPNPTRKYCAEQTNGGMTARSLRYIHCKYDPLEKEFVVHICACLTGTCLTPLDSEQFPLCFNGTFLENERSTCQGLLDGKYVNGSCFHTCHGIEFDVETVCSGHGICKSQDVCSCQDGYDGTKCELWDCYEESNQNTEVVCGYGRGLCVDENNCSCVQEYYYGDRCQLTTCFGVPSDDPSVCSNSELHQCEDYDKCKCAAEYLGVECNITSCHGILSNNTENVCSGHGKCYSHEQCSCQINYFESDCSVNICNGIRSDNISFVCSGHGTCDDFDACNCFDGWDFDSQKCSRTRCHDVFSDNNDISADICSGHGDCIGLDNCNCYDGWFGYYCNTTRCYDVFTNITSDESSSLCSGNGECVDYDTCVCAEHWFGETCNLRKCHNILSNESTVCGGHGHCADHNNCICDLEYGNFSKYCNVTECYGIESTNSLVCSSSNGTCINHNICECLDFYYGSECEIWECYGILTNTTTIPINQNETGGICHNHGDCVAANKCDCVDGYGGDYCQLKGSFSCNGIEWSNNNTNNGSCGGLVRGKCISQNLCECNEPFYFDKWCHTTTCFDIRSDDYGVSCGGVDRGECMMYNECSCGVNYVGDRCHVTYCGEIMSNDTDAVCSGRGDCVDFDTCECPNDKYLGDTCQFPICNQVSSDSAAAVCGGGRGECIDYNNCSCFDHYYGEFCSLTTCDNTPSNSSGVVCSSHGECIDYNICECDVNYYGKYCNITTCNGKLSNNSHSTCGDFGTCVDYDICKCESNYDHDANGECTITSCYGVSTTTDNDNDEEICSGRGDCVAFDNCECSNGPNINTTDCSCHAHWFGVNCNITSCYGVTSTSTTHSVCSTHGSCNDYNTCVCSEHWGYHESCNVTSCYNVRSDSVGVCHDHGVCVEFNECSCLPKYTLDNDCGVTSCFGVSETHDAVCSNGGTCVGYNDCTCGEVDDTVVSDGIDCSLCVMDEFCNDTKLCLRDVYVSQTSMVAQCYTDDTFIQSLFGDAAVMFRLTNLGIYANYDDDDDDDEMGGVRLETYSYINHGVDVDLFIVCEFTRCFWSNDDDTLYPANYECLEHGCWCNEHNVEWCTPTAMDMMKFMSGNANISCLENGDCTLYHDLLDAEMVIECKSAECVEDLALNVTIPPKAVDTRLLGIVLGSVFGGILLIVCVGILVVVVVFVVYLLWYRQMKENELLETSSGKLHERTISDQQIVLSSYDKQKYYQNKTLDEEQLKQLMVKKGSGLSPTPIGGRKIQLVGTGNLKIGDVEHDDVDERNFEITYNGKIGEFVSLGDNGMVIGLSEQTKVAYVDIESFGKVKNTYHIEYYGDEDDDDVKKIKFSMFEKQGEFEVLIGAKISETETDSESQETDGESEGEYSYYTETDEES